ncbi:hypothetical protein [Desulfofustis glycolicus]|uniref:hypothetical protein n=1 Tax=Desulfofustis glycolicus TaxID=51195 RepID=UPI00129484E7|nr:hypothetical protein [Desulfofustis glycolicus]MCB2215257.1 hypothetical protein [Desulfobulbaceae bacterium]
MIISAGRCCPGPPPYGRPAYAHLVEDQWRLTDLAASRRYDPTAAAGLASEVRR